MSKAELRESPLPAWLAPCAAWLRTCCVRFTCGCGSWGSSGTWAHMYVLPPISGQHLIACDCIACGRAHDKLSARDEPGGSATVAGAGHMQRHRGPQVCTSAGVRWRVQNAAMWWWPWIVVGGQ
mgnify:CR=1 FL=1